MKDKAVWALLFLLILALGIDAIYTWSRVYTDTTHLIGVSEEPKDSLDPMLQGICLEHRGTNHHVTSYESKEGETGGYIAFPAEPTPGGIATLYDADGRRVLGISPSYPYSEEVSAEFVEQRAELVEGFPIVRTIDCKTGKAL